MSESVKTLTPRIGVALSRVLVPLWVLAGALFKLVERDPRNLPVVILDFAWKKLHIDPLMLLHTLIGLELFAVAVMVLIARLSRAMAVFMLGCFCAILIGEIIMKAEKCGCFGSLPLKPWHMLVIDGTLLAAILLTSFAPRAQQKKVAIQSPRSLLKPALAMFPLLALTMLVSFLFQDSGTPKGDVAPPMVGNEVDLDAPIDPQINPNPQAVPSSWYIRTSAQQEWVGKTWRDIDLFQFMRRWPKDLNQGTHYVVFYSRTCEHCEEMFTQHLALPLDAPVAAVQIPSSRTVMTGEHAWAMSDNPCELLELPLGCNWIITPPLALTIVDGIVTCAVEGEGYEQCLGLQ